MKKLLILCLTLILLGCSTSSVKKKSVKGIKEIQYTELKKLMKEDVSFMLYLGRPDCGDCQAFKPILEDYLNKHPNEGVYYLNIKAYRDASLKKDATKEEIAEIQEDYDDEGIDVKIKDAKIITVELTINIPIYGSETDSEDFVVIKIGNSWYIDPMNFSL